MPPYNAARAMLNWLKADAVPMLLLLFRNHKQKPTRRLSLWMAALIVLSAALTSLASPQLLLRLVEEEKVSYAATVASVRGIASASPGKIPLRKRDAQYQAQHRFSFMRRFAQASQIAIIPDSMRFKTRLLSSRRSPYLYHCATRFLLTKNAQCSPRAPPFVLPLV